MHDIRVGARVWPIHVKGIRQWCSKSVITVKPASTQVLSPVVRQPQFSKFTDGYFAVWFKSVTPDGIMGYIVHKKDVTSDL